MEEPPWPDPQGQTRNELPGARVDGNALQIGGVHGDIYVGETYRVPPPARVPPRQLPADVTDWTNRNPELKLMARLTGLGPAGTQVKTLGRTRVPVVITGSAGIGKTALARHWASLVREDYPDAQLFADLRGFAEGPAAAVGSVLDRFLWALGVALEGIPAELDGKVALFRSLVEGRRVLILLDNASDADQVRPLLPGGSGTLVIITSRNRLVGLVAHGEARPVRLDVLRKSHAVDLLRRVMRAGRRRDSQDDLAELARLCGYIPLALRIVGVRATLWPEMPLADFFIEMRNELMILDALSTGDGPADEKVRAALALSYRDLPPDAARVFRALGLHPGLDISLPAAAAAAGLPARDARRELGLLIGASLVEPGKGNRYQLQSLLHAYALDQARVVDSEEDRRGAVGRIARWYIATAYRASQVLVPGREFALDASALTGAEPISFTGIDHAYAWFDTERPNLAAVADSAMDAELPRQAWELAMVLSPVHASYFTFDDWSVLSDLAMTAAEALDDAAARASALDNRGRYLFRRGHVREAEKAHARALAIQEDIGDKPGHCRSLNALGLICLHRRDLPGAICYLGKTIEEADEVGEPRWHDAASLNLAHAWLESGDPDRAMEILDPLPRSFAARDDQLNVGTSHQLSAWAHRQRGDSEAALTAIRAALQVAKAARSSAWEANWLIEESRVYLARGDLPEALRSGQRAASLQREIPDPGREATALDCVGEVLLAMGNAEEAAGRHREAAQRHRDRGDDWQEALALSHLADCEAALGHGGLARENAAEALAIIERFPDPRAVKISANLRQYHLD